MRRGTTPTQTFTTDIDLSDAVSLYITYKQNDDIIFEKNISDVTFGENKSFSVTLTQTETLLFSPMGEVLIQIRVKFPNGSAFASQIMHTTVEKILKDGVI